MDIAVETKPLRRVYRTRSQDVVALDGVDLHVRRGDRFYQQLGYAVDRRTPPSRVCAGDLARAAETRLGGRRLRLQLERHGVDAVALTGRRRAVVEDVAKM